MARSIYGQMSQANIGADISKLLEEMFTVDKATETSVMSQLIKMADTEEGLVTAKEAFKKFDKRNDSWGVYNDFGDVIGASLNAKSNEFAKYKASLSQAQVYYDSGMLDKEKLMKYNIDDFENLSREVGKLGEIGAIISNPFKFKYSIKGGQSNQMLKRDIDSRLGSIDSTLKALASTGQIPEELVEFVLMGESESVKSMITSERSKWRGLINKNLSYLKHAHNILARSNTNVDAGNVTLNPDDANDSEFLKMLGKVNIGQAKNTYDVPTMERWVEDFTNEHTRLNTEYSKWSRTKYSTDVDVDKLIEQYEPSKDKKSPSVSAGWHPPLVGKEIKKMYSSKEEMQKDIYGQTAKETVDNVLEEVTGKNLSEIKEDISKEDQSFWDKLFGLPVVREQLKKSRRGFEGALKVERDTNLNRKIKGAENYLAESLWKKMPRKEKSKHKKLSNFKNYFNSRMKGEYEKHIKNIGYEGTYLAWIKKQIEDAGLYMPMGLSVKTPF